MGSALSPMSMNVQNFAWATSGANWSHHGDSTGFRRAILGLQLNSSSQFNSGVHFLSGSGNLGIVVHRCFWWALSFGPWWVEHARCWTADSTIMGSYDRGRMAPSVSVTVNRVVCVKVTEWWHYFSRHVTVFPVFCIVCISAIRTISVILSRKTTLPVLLSVTPFTVWH